MFKPGSIPRSVIIVIPFLIAMVVTVITQYVLFIPVKSGLTMPWLGAVGLIVAMPLSVKFREHRLRGLGLGVAIVIGFLIVPYFAFYLSPIHVFAKDGPPSHWRVLEVRTTIDRIVWVEKIKGEIIVFQGPIALVLHPGEQRFHIGTMDIPAGTYTSGIVFVGPIIEDVEYDLSLTGADPDSYEDWYQNMQLRYGNEATEWSRKGATVKFTWNSGPKTATLTMGKGFDYPGMGGPDITLDFVMSEQDGKPEGVTVIYDLPPGISMPAIEVHV